MTTFGKVARLTGSVDEIKLVDTVEVVNCSTVLSGFNNDISVDNWCIARFLIVFDPDLFCMENTVG